MLVACDIGNTNIVLALFDNGSFVDSWRVYTDTKKTSDEYFVIFNALFREGGIKADMVDSAIISSVVPNMTRSVEKNIPERAVMVVDFGTALTLSAVNSKGEVLGCSIAPGLITAVNALFGNTAQLPQVELKLPDTTMGRDSQQSIRGGIMLGYAGLVDSIIKRTEEEIGEKLYVIATGGLSQTISPLIPRFDSIDSLHTLKGLALMAELNR